MRMAGKSWRIVPALILASAGQFAASAQEEPAPARPTPAAAEDSIATAKREFELLKSARDTSLQQKGEIPRVSVPDLHSLTPSSVFRGPVTPKSPLPSKKSANWLVDAMEKKTDTNQAREKFRGTRERDSRREREKSDVSLSSEGDRETSEESVVSRREENTEQNRQRPQVDAPTNPLAQYLSDWMTPKDYALLKPGLEASLATGGDPRESPGGFLPAGVSTPGSSNEPAFDFLQKSAGGLSTPPRENPFLQGLNVPDMTPPVVLPAPTSVGGSPAPAIISAPGAPPAAVFQPPSRIPDFAKQGQDDKYFKQLKRF